MGACQPALPSRSPFRRAAGGFRLPGHASDAKVGERGGDDQGHRDGYQSRNVPIALVAVGLVLVDRVDSRLSSHFPEYIRTRASKRQRAMSFVYTMYRVGKVVPPKRQILKDISLSFFPGAKIGILGLNGAGKSTVLRIMAGLDTDIDGEAKAMPNISVGFLEQEPKLDPEKTVRETVEEGLSELLSARKCLDEVFAAYGQPDADFEALAEEQARLEAILFAQGAEDVEQQLEIAADALRLPPWDAKIGPLSGGEKRRVALCRLLLSKPDMLLLDEPTNHLDAESVEWLEQFLARFPGTVVAVTHDRYFLDNAAEWILELDRGRGIPWKGNYSSWLEQKQERLGREETAETARRKALKRELEWVRSGVQGRRSKSKSRIARFEEL